MPTKLGIDEKLPSDVITNIASHTDEATIRSLMSCTRALRAGAEPALRPYLRQVSILAQPPFFSDILSAPEVDLENELTLCQSETLRATSHRFEEYCAVYPPAQSALRSLVLDVTCQHPTLSWPILQRFAPQLEELDIRIPAHAGSATPGDGAFTDAQAGWAAAIGKPPALLPRLTSLTITTSIGIMWQLEQVASSIPNLRSHSLQHLHRHPGAEADIASSLPTILPVFQHLRHVVVSGGIRSAPSMLAVLRPAVPNLARLVVHLHPHLLLAHVSRSLQEAINHMAMFEHLTHLALYGKSAHNLVWEIGVRQRSTPKAFSGVKVLELEDQIAQDTGGRVCIRSDFCLNDRPDFPVLERVVWVGLPKAFAGSQSIDTRELYSESMLRGLFARYPTLRTCQWVSGYPTQPFGTEDPSVWAEQGVICTVHRPSGDKGLQPVFFHIA